MSERISMPLEIIFTDGGSRGNPGPAAAGFVVRGVGYLQRLGHRRSLR
jgi:ribonuclease HI